MILAPFILTALTAALPATPDDRPGKQADAWFVFGNDALGVPPGPDDNRTAELTIGGQTAVWALVLDDSILTYFTDPFQRQGARCDELTLGAWWRPCVVWLGAGVRVRGDLGGGSVQNWWHRLGQGHTSEITYEGDTTWSPLIGVALRHSWEWVGVVVDGWLGADGDVMADAEARLWIHNDDSAGWLGLRWQERHPGSQAGSVVRDVYHYEQGPWLSVGVRASNISFETRFGFWRGEGVGALTISVE